MEARGMTPQELEVIALSTAKLVKSAVLEAQVPLLARIAELEGRAAVPGPAGPQGERGADGRHGKDGRDGIDGKDGAPGPEGQRGLDGIHGKDGANGRDGISVASALINKDGALVLTLSDGSLQTLGIVIGRDGAIGQKGDPGPAGQNGTLENVKLVRVSRRSWQLQFNNGQPVDGDLISADFPEYQGVFKEGETYEAGDAVTFGGSMFIANETTTGKPEQSPVWRLACKRGRDGREGKAGPPGPKGEKGDTGIRHA
jgi:hypothetical protein